MRRSPLHSGPSAVLPRSGLTGVGQFQKLVFPAALDLGGLPYEGWRWWTLTPVCVSGHVRLHGIEDETFGGEKAVANTRQVETSEFGKA